MIEVLIHGLTVAGLLGSAALAGLFWWLNREPAFRAMARSYLLLALAASWLLVTEFWPALAVREIRVPMYRGLFALAMVQLLVELVSLRRRKLPGVRR